jgi:hypothetical protein
LQEQQRPLITKDVPRQTAFSTGYFCCPWADAAAIPSAF